jgi:hypothetical protein
LRASRTNQSLPDNAVYGQVESSQSHMYGKVNYQALAGVGALMSVYTSKMTSAENMKPRPGDAVVLTQVPPGMLDDLPSEDQEAITRVVGKPILLSGYDEDGRAELEFQDRNGNFHFIYVGPEFVRRAV